MKRKEKQTKMIKKLLMRHWLVCVLSTDHSIMMNQLIVFQDIAGQLTEKMLMKGSLILTLPCLDQITGCVLPWWYALAAVRGHFTGYTEQRTGKCWFEAKTELNCSVQIIQQPDYRDQKNLSSLRASHYLVAIMDLIWITTTDIIKYEKKNVQTYWRHVIATTDHDISSQLSSVCLPAMHYSKPTDQTTYFYEKYLHFLL